MSGICRDRYEAFDAAISTASRAAAYTPIDLGTLAGGKSFAYGINDSGQVVGWSDTASGYAHAFIAGANGVGMTDLGTLGGSASYAWGINASGQVVGQSYIAGNAVQHAFITGANGLGMTDLNSLVSLGGGDYFRTASGVNDSGQIIVNTYLGHAYLLTPVPEADSWAMMLAGLGLVGGVARRRKLRGT
jgi:MYXO-CTERM domain-containing protein